MISVSICDDEELFVSSLAAIVKDICEKYKKQVKLRTYTNGNLMLSDSEESDIFFVDLSMPQIDGIELCKKIRKTNPNCVIIIASSMESRFKETYEFQAFRFVSKPYSYEEIEEALSACFLLCSQKETICLYFNRKPCEVKLNSIELIESVNGDSEFSVGGKIFRREGSLNKMEEILPKQFFFRINRLFIANFRFISSYSDGYVFVGKKRIAVSRGRKSEFLKAYSNYILQYKN